MILRRVIAHFRKQEWTALALDFLIVVAGILLAFQITEWNDARRDRALERDYLQRIAAELDHSIVEIEDSIRIASGREELGRFLMDCVDNQDLVRAEPGRFIAAVIQAGYTFSPTIRAQRRRTGLRFQHRRDRSRMASISSDRMPSDSRKSW